MDSNATSAADLLDACHVLATLSQDCEIAADLQDSPASEEFLRIEADWAAIIRVRRILVRRADDLIDAAAARYRNQR